MKVIWVKHPIYKVEVSNTGLVKGVSGTVRKPRFDRYGYLRINVYHAGKLLTKPIHKLVYESFNGKSSKLTIDHIDGNKTNNNIENLQLLSSGENTQKYFKQTSKYEVVVDNVVYKSKREYERLTGNSRHKLKD